MAVAKSGCGYGLMRMENKKMLQQQDTKSILNSRVAPLRAAIYARTSGKDSETDSIADQVYKFC